MNNLKRVSFLLFLLGFVATLVGCNSGKLKAMPAELKGTWNTSAKKFKGFTFEISDTHLTFNDQNAKPPTEEYPISKITKDKKKQNVYTIYYKSKDSQEYQFSFYFDPSGGGSIRLKNQRKYVWKKVKE